MAQTDLTTQCDRLTKMMHDVFNEHRDYKDRPILALLAERFRIERLLVDLRHEQTTANHAARAHSIISRLPRKVVNRLPSLAWVYTGVDVGEEPLSNIEIDTEPFFKEIDESLLKKDFPPANIRDARPGSEEHRLIDALVIRLSTGIRTNTNIGYNYRRIIMRDLRPICEGIRNPPISSNVTRNVLNEDCLTSSASDDNLIPDVPLNEDSLPDAVPNAVSSVVENVAKPKIDAEKETDSGAGEVQEKHPEETLEAIVEKVAEKTAERILAKISEKISEEIAKAVEKDDPGRGRRGQDSPMTSGLNPNQVSHGSSNISGTTQEGCPVKTGAWQ